MSRLSLAAASGGSSLAARRLLSAVTSLVAEHGLWGMWAQGCGSRARGVFLGRGSNPRPLHQQWILDHWSTRGVRVFLICSCFSQGSYLLPPSPLPLLLPPSLLPFLPLPLFLLFCLAALTYSIHTAQRSFTYAYIPYPAPQSRLECFQKPIQLPF